MRFEIKEMAGVDNNQLPKDKKERKVTKSDSIRSMAGLNESSDDILVEDKNGIDKLYRKLLEEFEDDTDSINKIKEVFSKVVIK